MVEYDCPKCGKELNLVRYNPDCLLNAEQWSSIKAGDYFCNICPGDRGKSEKRYYWKSELEELTETESKNCV